MQCLNCNKDVESQGTKPRKYCSDACRKAHKRTGKRTQADTKTEETDVKLEQTDKTDAQRCPTIDDVKPIGTKPPIKFDIDIDYSLNNDGGAVCGCYHCRAVQSNKLSVSLNHGPYKPSSELAVNELNRVSLPGDADYRSVI